MFAANSGAYILDSNLPSTLFTFSGVPTAAANLTGRATFTGTVLVDAVATGIEASLSDPAAIDPFAGFSVTFDIDFATGEVTRGRMLFGSGTDLLSEVFFSGLVLASGEGNAAVMTVEQGLLFGQPLDA
ncbi:MAG: hypothetical protein ACO2YP_06260 [Pseudomonadales bacterium]